MSLRVNNNTAALNGIRNLQKNDAAVSKSLERLSSGLKINRASDNSAGLIISEQMRAQLKGINTAMENTQTAVSMLQTAEGALDEVSTLLNKARGLGLHAANEGVNDNNQLVADQTELDNILTSVDRIASSTQFGTKKLLDGTMSSFRSNNSLIQSTQTGDHYASNLKTGMITKGYHSIQINNAGTYGSLFINGGESGIISGAEGSTLEESSGSDQFQKSFTVAVNGVQLSVASGSTKSDFLAQLNTIGKTLGFTAVVVSGGATASASLSGYASIGTQPSQASTGAIVLINNTVGSAKKLSLSFVSGASGATSFNGTFSTGTDMSATLYLHTGAVGSVATTGASADFRITLVQSGNSPTLVSTQDGNAVAVTDYRINLANSLGGGLLDSVSGSLGTTGMFLAGAIDGTTSGATFQIGANSGQTASVEMASARASDLGRGVSSTYRSLGELGGALTSGNAQDALKVIDKAIDDVTVMRGKLGAFQSNTLETNISSLSIANENLTAAESTIRDVDFAEESARFTKNNILVQSATAMLAQANQLPNNVLKLLG